jgi:hypothetical protein
MAGDLAAGLVVIVDPPEVVAVRERRERAVERQELHAVAGQVELADDLRPEQRHDVGTDRELVARKHLFGDRGTADEMAALEDDHLASRAREIRSARQSVVPAPDHDRVVHVRHGKSLPCRRASRADAPAILPRD